MTATFRQQRPSAPVQPSPRRLLASAMVGGVGAIAFSIAVGSYVVGSNHRLDAATAVEAGTLVAATPSFVLLGFIHLAVAAALLGGGRRLRIAAVTVTAVAAFVALGSAAALVTGIDLFGGPGAGQPTTQGVARLLLAAAAYGVAAITASPSSAEG